MSSCVSCSGKRLEQLYRFQKQPITNRFLKQPTESEAVYSFDLFQCPNCALVQLSPLVPFEELRPRVDWITYVEPEDHLDHLANTLSTLPGLKPDSRFYGVTFKDDSLLDRMVKKGYQNVVKLRSAEDYEIKEAAVGAESIQDRVNPEQVKKIIQRRGKADVVIVRHILEHAHNYPVFWDGLKSFLSPDRTTYLVVEIPDCSKALHSGDPTMVWEEHTAYFTSDTFRRAIEDAGLSVLEFQVHPYALEDSLVAICTLSGARTGKRTDVQTVESQLAVGREYAEKMVRLREFWAQRLETYKREGRRLAVFGAGHLSCAFLNYFKIEKYFEVVLDDNAHKKNLYMPGSKLPIRGSEALLAGTIDVAIFGLSPTAEPKIAQRNAAFLQNGGKFLSMLPNSEFFPKGEFQDFVVRSR